MRTFLIALALVAVGFTTSACPKAPPSLSPDEKIAFYQNQVQHAIDLFENFAIDANKAGVPQFSDATTAAIVKWHSTATDIIHAASGNWRQQVESDFNTLVNALPLETKQKLLPYIPLVITILETLPS